MDWLPVVEKVREFHRRRNLPIPNGPRLLPQDVGKTVILTGKLVTLAIDMRNMSNLQQLIDPEWSGEDLLGTMAIRQLESLAAWLKAHVQGDLEGAAFAWGDRLYLLLSEAVAAGLSPEEIFRLTHKCTIARDLEEKAT